MFTIQNKKRRKSMFCIMFKEGCDVKCCNQNNKSNGQDILMTEDISDILSTRGEKKRLSSKNSSNIKNRN